MEGWVGINERTDCHEFTAYKYKVFRHCPGQWWAYYDGAGLGINELTCREAQAFCERHAEEKGSL